jgi:wyosine [tRNA(Phe)-imidazoG37] synthetase (radical SAM superfamily)
VESSIEAAARSGETIDYLTFVPDGEPTLDENIGTTIEMLCSFGLKIAVISNASLIWREDVRERLSKVDWLSLKIDSLDKNLWRNINQPHPDLQLDWILEGIKVMANSFQGELTTETMLVNGINNNKKSLSEIGDFLAQVKPSKAYLAVPTRPTAQAGIHLLTEEQVNRAYQIIFHKFSSLEYLIGYEGNAFASSGDVVKDLLSITAVHPMRSDAVNLLLEKNGLGWDIISMLLDKGQLREIEYEGHRFYIRAMNT